MDTLNNQNIKQPNQANNKEKYGQLTDVPSKELTKDQLNQSLVP